MELWIVYCGAALLSGTIDGGDLALQDVQRRQQHQGQAVRQDQPGFGS